MLESKHYISWLGQVYSNPVHKNDITHFFGYLKEEKSLQLNAIGLFTRLNILTFLLLITDCTKTWLIISYNAESIQYMT